MTAAILFITVVLFVCVFASKLSGRLGVPSLLLFMLVGMIFGSDGIFKIPFDDFQAAEYICSFALIFIMFYGGFGTKWKAARPVAAQSIVLSVAGVIVTAALTGVFCWLVLHMDLLEGLLVGAVVGSTDAASVFAILRSKKLNLKYNLASLLEVESGSNDPTSYSLTVLILSLMSANASGGVFIDFVLQFALGIGCGFAIGYLSFKALCHIRLDSSGMHTIFVVAIALLAYALPSLFGGNGYLSVYIAGIFLGNSKITAKAELVHAFDTMTGLMQILLFFLLGLLSFPSQMLSVILPAIAIAAFMTFVARPAAVFAILAPFGHSFRQMLLVSWAGLRGASSIVFAIYTITNSAYTKNDIFHIVFCVALLSVAFQGTLLAPLSKKLGLVGDDSSVLKTFNDYQDESDMKLVEMKIWENSTWVGRTLGEVHLPSDALVVMIKRAGETIIPRGSTLLQKGDTLVVSCQEYQDDSETPLTEIPVTPHHKWNNKTLGEINLPVDSLVVMVKREGSTVIPHGETVVQSGDVLVLSGATHRKST